MDGLDQDIAATAIPDGVPEWVQLLPAGTIPARDGRPAWQLGNAAAVVASSRALAMDLVVDYEHQTDHAPENGRPAPAAGWIKALDARPDGIWGRVEWTAKAREMLQAREYRYLSPVFQYDRASREVTRLLRAALTNDPALYMQALARRTQEETDMDLLKQLATLFGLAATADAAAVAKHAGDLVAQAKSQGEQLKALAKAAGVPETAKPEEVATAIATAVAAGKPDPAKFVAIADFEKVSTAFATVQKERAEEKATAAVDKAIADGKLTPAQRDWALDFCKSDPARFAAFVEKQPVIVAPGARPGAGKPTPADAPLDDEDKAVCRQLGITEEAFRKQRQKQQEA